MPYIGNIVQDFSVNNAMLNTDSVTSIKIDDGTIVNADINASAAIDVSKLSGVLPLAGGTLTGNLILSSITPQLYFTDTNHNPDFAIWNHNGVFKVLDTTNGADRFRINSDGHVDVTGNLDVGSGLDVTGAITGTGDLTIDTNTLYVDSTNNRVGIGTTSPTHMLDISGSNPILALNDTDTTNDRFRLTYNGGSSQLQVDPNNVRSGSHLLVAVDGTERMRIDTSGRLLVGTTSTNQNVSKLVINASSPSGVFDNHLYLQGNETNGAISTGGVLGFGGHDGASSARNWCNIVGLKENSTTGNTAAFLGFQTRPAGGNPTERMRIDSSGRVGIGTTSPAQLFHVNGQAKVGTLGVGQDAGSSTLAITGNMAINTTGNTLYSKFNIAGSGSTTGSAFTINNYGDAEGDYYHFGVNATQNASGNNSKTNTAKRCAAVRLDGRMGSITLQTSQTSTSTIDEHFTFDRGGDFTLSGNVKVANGKGIDFSATSDASGKTSELLDDYEEGTFTPVLNNAGSFSVNNHTGTYTKVGRLVHYIVQISGTCTGTGSGIFTVSGLPFSANNATGGHGQAGCMGALFRWNIPDTAYQIGIRVSDSNSFIQFFANFDNANDAQLTSPFDAGTIFGSLAGSYFTS